MITKKQWDHYYEIATLQRMSKAVAKEMEQIIQEKIDPRYSVCTKCAAQMKHGQKILMNWLYNQQVLENVILLSQISEEPVLEMEELPAPEVDVVEADKVGCTKCKRKRQTKS